MTEVEVGEQQVDAVRYLAGRQFTPLAIARALGLPVEAVRGILARKRDRARPKGGRPLGRPRALTTEQVVEAARMRAEGVSYLAIGRVLGVNRETVRLALQRAARLANGADPVPDVPAAAHSGSAPSSPGWPPPVVGSVQWLTRPLRGGGSVRLRPLPLAGRIVEVDADGQLFCDDCFGLFSIEQALSLNPREHRIGLARHPGALVQPLTDRDNGRPFVEPVQYMGAW